MRNAIALFSILALSACGASAEQACEDYIAASTACLDEAFAEDTSGIADAYYTALEGYCDAYAEASGSEAKEAVDLLNCYTDAINAADCSTAEGYAAIDTMSCVGA